MEAGVPLVLVPTTWDKPDNARRVSEHGGRYPPRPTTLHIRGAARRRRACARRPALPRERRGRMASLAVGGAGTAGAAALLERCPGGNVRQCGRIHRRTPVMTRECCLTCSPFEGHVFPALSIALAMRERGGDVASTRPAAGGRRSHPKGSRCFRSIASRGCGIGSMTASARPAVGASRCARRARRSENGWSSRYPRRSRICAPSWSASTRT